MQRQNEFDRALGIYEGIIQNDPTDAEGYFGMALCKYGIEYVDDVATGKKVLTCQRTRLTLLSQDADFQKAISLSDEETKQVYEAEAAAIDTTLRKILELSGKE